MSALELQAKVRELVEYVVEHGSLQGGRYGRTMTLDGRRRYTVRVQVDVVDALLGHPSGWSYYPDLAWLIDDAVAAVRSSSS